MEDEGILTAHEIEVAKGVFDNIVERLENNFISNDGAYLLCGREQAINNDFISYAICAISKNYTDLNPKILLSVTKDNLLGIIFLGINTELNRDDEMRNIVIYVMEEMRKYLSSRIELVRIEQS